MASLEDQEYPSPDMGTDDSDSSGDSSDSDNMSDIDDADAFYEELNPDFKDKVGAFKTDNPKTNRWQRRYIHTSQRKSRFSKKIESVLVVHGWETPEKKQPMTLVVLSARVNTHDRNVRIKSARMWFAFYEDTTIDPPNREKASPEVVAFAPFVQQETGEEDPEDREVTNSLGGTLGVEKLGKLGINTNRDSKHSFIRKHFDRGTAELMVANDKPIGVNWYCEHNDLQTYGIKPNFYLAVLLKRNHTATTQPETVGKPISFSGVFDMKIEGGTTYDLTRGVLRAFRLGRPEDEAIYYHGDPDKEAQVGGIDKEGEALLAKVVKDHLGKYNKSSELAKLLPELEPMAPSKGSKN